MWGRLPPLLLRPVIQYLEEQIELWFEAGIHEWAELGWPLEIDAGEFISINRWHFAKSVECLFQELLDAAAAETLSPAACLRGCPRSARNARSYCWLKCMWDALTTELPAERVRAIIAAARTSASCPPLAHGLTFAENADGPGDFWDSNHPAGYNYKRLVSEMRAWYVIAPRACSPFTYPWFHRTPMTRPCRAPHAPIPCSGMAFDAVVFRRCCRLTKASNESVYQGWHAWHMDGPADYGRFHKVRVTGLRCASCWVHWGCN